MIRRVLLTVAAASAVAFAAGCRGRCCHKDPDFRPNPYRPQAPNSPFLLPPSSVPTAPDPVPGPGSIVPGVGPADLRNYPPPLKTDPLTKPAPEVLLPDPVPGSTSKSSSPGDPGYGVLGKPTQPSPPAPVIAKSIDAATGLPGYARAKEGVASGRRPTLDGFDWLKRSGFRTVVFLHAAGADTSAAKDVAEKRGLKFLAIETTPEKLADALGQFNAAVGDRTNRLAYVVDDDGVRAGALWYLHFRTADAMNEDAARVRAKSLGYTNAGTEGQAFALAVQQYLATR